MSEPSLKEKTAKGLLWGAVNNGTQQVLVLVFGIILGRILGPEEYGMVGMLAIFTLIGSALQESGFRAALANLKTVRHEDYNAVFWCSTGIGLIVYIFLFLSAPLIARFYDEPALTPLARYCFLAIPIAGIGTVQGAYLFRNLKVRQQAASGIIAHVTSGIVGITLAFCGFSYWGIATQNLTYILVVTVCSWHFSPWRPAIRIDLSPIKPLFAFSSKLLVTNIAYQLNNNLLSVVLGKFFTPQSVGNYNQANKWNATGHQFVTGMISGVAQPVLASIHEDRKRKSRVFRKILRFTAFLTFPAMFGLSAVTEELILIAVGWKWAGSIPLMQMLCIGGAFLPISSLFSSLIISQGKSDIYMWNIVSQVLLQLAVVLLLAAGGGDVFQMVVCYVCINVCWVFVWQRFARRYIHLPIPLLLKDLCPFFFCGLAACASGWYAASWANDSQFISLAVKIIVAAPCYCLLIRAVQPEMLEESANYLQSRKKRPHVSPEASARSPQNGGALPPKSRLFIAGAPPVIFEQLAPELQERMVYIANLLHFPKQKPLQIMHFLLAGRIPLPQPILNLWFPKEGLGQLTAAKSGDSILLYEGTNVRSLKALRRILPKDVTCHIYYCNPISSIFRQPERSLKAIRKLGYLLSSFDFCDARKYGLAYTGQYFCYPPESLRLPEASDCFFCGLPKNRKDVLDEIRRLMEAKGFVCDFVIPAAPSEKITYPEYLRRLSRSRCVVDICQEGQTGLTRRPLEALFYGKKLITNNERITEFDFYNPNNVFIFGKDSIDALDKFMQTQFTEIPREVKDKYDINRWIRQFLNE